MFGDKALELDAEGVTYDNGSFYVIGSHGRPRQEEDKSPAEIAARTRASRHLYRIDLALRGVDLLTGRLTPGAAAIVESAPLDPWIKADQRLASELPLAQNGLTIEGLAVKGGVLTLGFRGPSVEGAAVVLSLPLLALFEAKPGQASVELLPLGVDTNGKARGIRDIVAVADGFVGIAGSVTDPADKSYEIRRGDYALFWWDGKAAPTLRDLDGYGVQIKPEALVPLEFRAGKMRALLLFDGPPAGRPQVVNTEFLSKK
jgi:hypothetical protein